MNRETALIKACLENDLELQYGKLTICDLHHYLNQKTKYRWQVYCTDSKATFSQNFINIDEAIKKFIELKQLIQPRVR